MEGRVIREEWSIERGVGQGRVEYVGAKVFTGALIERLCLPIMCHKLHSAISPSILHRFSQSQWLRKALEKTFR